MNIYNFTITRKQKISLYFDEYNLNNFLQPFGSAKGCAKTDKRLTLASQDSPLKARHLQNSPSFAKATEGSALPYIWEQAGLGYKCMTRLLSLNLLGSTRAWRNKMLEDMEISLTTIYHSLIPNYSFTNINTFKGGHMYQIFGGLSPPKQ